MKNLRVAVLGTGHLGRHHARVLASTEGVQLVGVVDPSEERGRAVADALSCRWFPGTDDLPEDLDAVSIAAPTPLHFEAAKGYLERGVHCMVEKPMTATVEEARALADIAERSGRILAVGHIERFNPVFDAVESMGLRPRAIHAERLAPHSGRSLDTSVVFDLMIHDLDLVCALASSRVTDLEAVAGTVIGPREDWAEARLLFENGVRATVAASRVAPAAARRMRIQCDERTAHVDFATRKVDVVEPFAAPGEPGTVAGSPQVVHTVQGGEAEPLRRELDHFLACIRDGQPPKVGPREGLAAVELASLVLARAGRA